MQGLLDTLFTFLKSGTFRRWAAGIVVSGVVALGNKYGLALSDGQLAMITGIVMTLIAGSNYKEATIAKAEIAGAAAAANPGPALDQ